MNTKKIFLIGILTILTIGIVVENTNAKKEKIHPTKFSAIYGNTTTNDILIEDQDIRNVANFTFYLPVPSYVYIETSGEVIAYNHYVYVNMGIEGNPKSYEGNFRQYGQNEFTCDYCVTGFHISKVVFLNSGNHTLRFYAGSSIDGNDATVDSLSFIVIANQKGGIGNIT